MVPHQFSALLSFVKSENVSKVTHKKPKLVFGLSVEEEKDRNSHSHKPHIFFDCRILLYGKNTMAENQIPICLLPWRHGNLPLFYFRLPKTVNNPSTFIIIKAIFFNMEGKYMIN